MYRVLVTGGGTGGHVYPAVSIASGFLQRNPESEVLYVGSKQGIEKRVVSDRNLPFESLRVQGVVGKSRLEQIKGAFSLLKATYRAMGIVARFNPDIVVGTGGYVSVPAVSAAQLRRLPTVIQEQNVIPGQANRMLSRASALILLPSERSSEHFPKQTREKQVVTGNPIRQEFSTTSRSGGRKKHQLAEDDFVVLAFGGSGGAEVLNRGITDFIVTFFSEYDSLSMIYVTGRRYYSGAMGRINDDSNAKRLIAQGRLQVHPYLDDVPSAMVASDLLLCRAGAMTLAEATAVGLPMIIVPSPNVSNDEQRHNAEVLREKGAAEVIEDAQFTARELNMCFKKLTENSEKIKKMSFASESEGKPKALDRIVDNIENVLQGR